MKLFSKNKEKLLRKWSNKLTLSQEKDQLFKSIERIGIVAIRKLEKGQEQSLSEILDLLENIFLSFLKLQDTNIDKFKAFLSDSTRLPYVQNVNIDNDDEIFKMLSEETDFTNAQKPDPISIPHDMEQIYSSYSGIQMFTNVLYRIWFKADELKYFGLATEVLLKINSILKRLVPNYSNLNRNIIGYFLDLQSKIIRIGTYSFDDRKLYLIYSYFTWYRDLVFKKDFDVRYQTVFNRNLFINCQIVIDKNVTSLYNHFVSSVIDGQLLNVYTYDNYQIINTINILDKKRGIYYTFDSQIRSNAIHCYSSVDLTKILSEIQQFKLQHPSWDNEKSEKFEKNLYNLSLNYYKYNNLRMIFLWAGSYCLYKERYNLLNDQLYYNQPKDSSASWVNKDINPTTVGEIINLLLRKYEIESSVVFGWGGHSDFMGYFHKYLLLLFTHITSQSTRYGKDISIENYKVLFENKSKDQLNQVKNELETQKIIAERTVKKENNYLTKLSYTNDLITKMVIPLIGQLINECSIKYESIDQYSKLDESKVDLFINAVIDVFHKRATFRNIISYYNNEIPSLLPFNSEIKAYGINEISPKSYFAEGDTGMYVGWPEGFANRLVFQNNMFIEQTWKRKCKVNKKITNDKVLEIVNSHIEKDVSNNFIILGTNMRFPFQVFGNEKEYQPTWQISEKEDWWDQTQLVGFYKNHAIFNKYDQSNTQSFFVLNKNHLGTLKQYMPFKEEAESEIHDIFYFTIDAYSQNNKILSEIITKAPAWLKEQGDEDAQRAFLLKQVRIMIFESFTLELDDKFVGYSYYIQDVN